MKRAVIAVLAGVFIAGMVTCRTLNPGRIACDRSCMSARDTCHRKSMDAKGNLDREKKLVCDARANRCIDECAKK